MTAEITVSTSVKQSHLCSATHGDLAVLRSRTKTYEQWCFTVSGPTLDFPSLMFYRTHVMHLCSGCNRRARNP